MILRFKLISFLLIFSFNTSAQSNYDLAVKSLETENTIAAKFYIKNLEESTQQILMDVECFILNGEFIEGIEFLDSLSTKNLSACDAVKFHYLKAVLEHKRFMFKESAISIELSEKLMKNCQSAFQICQMNYWLGFVYLEQRNFPLAKKNILNALSFYKKDSSRFYVKNAKLFFWLGTLNHEQGNFDSAIHFLKKSLLIFENTPLDKDIERVKIYNNLGNSYSETWDYKNAVSAYKLSVKLNQEKIKNTKELAIACANLGNFYDKYENYIQSEQWYEQAFQWMQGSNIEPARKALILMNYGSSLANRFEPQRALNYYLQALEIILPYKEIHGDSYAKILLNIIKSNRYLGNKAESVRFATTLTSFFNQNSSKWPDEFYSWQLDEAIDLRQNGELEKSIIVLIELEQHYSNLNEEIFYTVLEHKAICLNGLKRFKESIECYKKIINHYKELLPISHPKLIYATNDIGSIFLEKSQFDSALHYLQLAKKNNLLKPIEEFTNGLYASKIEWIVSNFHLIMLDIRSFKSGKLSIEELKQSEGLIYSTLSVIESKRIEFRNDQDITNLYRMTRDFFDEAMKYYFILYHHTGNKQYIDKAFFISEKSKYQTLQNAMKLDRVSAFAGVTNKLMQEEQKLASRVAQLEYQYSQELAKQEEPLPELVQEYVTQWHSNSNRLNHLVDSIKNNLPNYYNLKFNRTTTEISEIQTGLLSRATDMAWVSYYVGYTDCYAIVITHDHKYLLKLDPTEKITRQLKSFNNYVSHHINDELQQTSQALYSGLFQQVDSCLKTQTRKIKKVVVIPDGALNYLNFELLGKPTSKSWHYALYDYQFSYGYSSTLLFNEFSDQPKWKPGTLSMIGFAPEFIKISRQESGGEIARDANEKPGYDFFDFSPLEKNQEEVSHVAEILKHKKIKTTLYLGSKADESSFKKTDLNSYDIIHLATHGFVSEQQQSIAGIAFAKNESSMDDGILYMDEIFSLKNRANLVCLSACETGSGVLQEGEGLVGLTRAFIYSGAQNMVVSLWKVQDESTAMLMTNFYSSLVKNQSVSESLQHAKIAMIKKNPTIHPYYWSAFIHVGLN